MRSRIATMRSPGQTHEYSCNTKLITRAMFPSGGAGDYTYQEAIESYGSQYIFHDPRKTFRFTISTTF